MKPSAKEQKFLLRWLQSARKKLIEGKPLSHDLEIAAVMQIIDAAIDGIDPRALIGAKPDPGRKVENEGRKFLAAAHFWFLRESVARQQALPAVAEFWGMTSSQVDRAKSNYEDQARAIMAMMSFAEFKENLRSFEKSTRVCRKN